MITDRMKERYVRRILNGPTVLRLYTHIGDAERSIVEARGGGYSSHVIQASDWSVTGGLAQGQIHEFRFDGTARLKIAGAYLTDDVGYPLWIYPFADVLPVGRAGDIIPVRASFSMGVMTT